jgi:nucleoside-diphosphate-sugar epimerase
VKQLIFASSASVYGLKPEPRVTEDLELLPLSEYNKTKMVAERVVLSYAGEMTTTIIRPATVCGLSPRMRLDVVVNMLTMQALAKGAVTVLGGDQTGFPQDTQRPQRDIFQVADRRRDDIQGGHR